MHKYEVKQMIQHCAVTRVGLNRHKYTDNL